MSVQLPADLPAAFLLGRGPRGAENSTNRARRISAQQEGGPGSNRCATPASCSVAASPADDFHDFRVYGDEPGRYEFDFDTAWVSPVNAWNKLGDMFPTLDFSVEGREPLADFALRGTIKDGGLLEYELMDQPGTWEAIDLKTGKITRCWGRAPDLGGRARVGRRPRETTPA